jgi:hypothetical protein
MTPTLLQSFDLGRWANGGLSCHIEHCGVHIKAG